MIHGLFLVDKPEGITSHDVLARIQRAWLQTRPALKKRDLPALGHGGTLDPFATGLLIVACGDATKLTRYFLNSKKRYFARVRMGEKTESGDRTNSVIQTTEYFSTPQELEHARQLFLSRPYLQTPPMYSAKKQDGVALYTLARQGIEMERTPIPRQIFELKLRDFDPSDPRHFSLETTVSSGTYVRTLAEDLVEEASSLAHLTELRRLGSGPWSIDSAYGLDALSSSLQSCRPEDWGASLPCFVPFDEALREVLPSLSISPPLARRILHGETTALSDVPIAGFSPGPIALYLDAQGLEEPHRAEKLLAVIREEDGIRSIDRAFPLRFKNLD